MTTQLLAGALAVIVAAPALAQTRAIPASPPPEAVAPSAAVGIQPQLQPAPERARAAVFRLGVSDSARSPMGTVATNALYGGGAGLLVGIGVSLIERANYGRDIAVGTGLGVVIGAAVGAWQAYGSGPGLAATDGLGTIQRDRALRRSAPTASYAFRW